MRLTLSALNLKQALPLLAIGAVGALAGEAAGIPAGAMMGALVAIGAYQLLGGQTRPWSSRYGVAGRLLIGATIGASFSPEVLVPLRSAIVPMLIMIAALIAVGLSLGLLMSRLAHLDLPTALISSMPGGLPAMAAMGEDLRADCTAVSAIHFARLIVVLVATPALMSFLPATGAATAGISLDGPAVGLGRTAAALLIAVVAGVLAMRLHIPTGDLTGATVVLAVLNLAGAGLGPLPVELRDLAMLLIGISVGAGMTRESVRRLGQIVVPAAINVAVLMATGLALGWLLAQVTHLDLVTALLSCVPGGAATMPVIAYDLGGDARLVAALHLVRQLVIFLVVPSVLTRLLHGRRPRCAADGQVESSP